MLKNHSTPPSLTKTDPDCLMTSSVCSRSRRLASVVSLGYGALLTFLGCLTCTMATADPYVLQIMAMVVTGLGISSAVISFILLAYPLQTKREKGFAYMGINQPCSCADYLPREVGIKPRDVAY